MDKRETYRSTLRYAVAIAGGEHALSVRLKVTIPVLRNWLDAIEPVPGAIFLEAVDIICSATQADITRSRDALNTTEIPKPESG